MKLVQHRETGQSLTYEEVQFLLLCLSKQGYKVSCSREVTGHYNLQTAEAILRDRVTPLDKEGYVFLFPGIEQDGVHFKVCISAVQISPDDLEKKYPQYLVADKEE